MFTLNESINPDSIVSTNASEIHPSEIHPSEIHPVKVQPLDKIAATLMTNTDEDADLFNLLEKCHNGEMATLTKDSTTSGSQQERKDKWLESCFPIEISCSARSMGHCSDLIFYVYYAGARLSEQFDEESNKKHAEKCPNSIRLHNEFPIEEFLNNPNIRNYWIPNVENIWTSQDHIFEHTHTILGKTRHSINAVRKYMQGRTGHNPNLVFMGHSSTDPLVTGTNEHPRDFSKVFHSYGSSTRKSTHQIIECWDKNPTWPELTILGKSEIRSSNNVKWIKEVSIHDLREFQRNHSIHLCPSTMEGFGHYINEARGNGAVVLTTDYGPMNEFVQDGHSGILVEYANTYGESNELIATVYPIGVTVHSAAICKGVERIFSMSLKERELMGDRARNAFLADRAYFQMTLKQLKKEAESFFEE